MEQSARTCVGHTMRMERTQVQILALGAKVRRSDFILSITKRGSILCSGAEARLSGPQSPHLYNGDTGKHLSGRAVVRSCM